MGFFVSIFLFLVCIFVAIKRKTLVAPSCIYCIEWGFISLLASMQLFGMHGSSMNTWFIVFLGSAFFLLGVNLGDRIKIKYDYYTEDNINFYSVVENRQVVSNRFFWIVIVCLLLYKTYNLVYTIQFINMGYSLGDIRDASYGIMDLPGFNKQTGIVFEMLDLVVSVFEVYWVAIGIESFVFNFKLNWKKIMAVFLVEVLDSFSTGSRFVLAYFIVELLVCIGVYKYCGHKIEFSISKRLKKWINRLVIFGIALILVISLLRGAEVGQLIKKYYRYISGNIKFLDLHLQQIDSSGFTSIVYSGLYGFWSFILPWVNALGFSYPQRYLDAIRYVFNTQVFLEIGDGMYTNAFITPFYYLYADLRYYGVMLGMFVFGAYSGYRFRKARKEISHMQIVLYLIVGQMIFKSLQLYPLTSKTYVFVLLVAFIGRFMRKPYQRKEGNI